MQSNPQVPWTEEQWARVNQAIQEEAQRARVAAKCLPLYGPLPPETDFVRSVDIPDEAPLKINDKKIIQLSTLQLKVELRGAQLADPEMGSALSLFRRAANILARLEDALVFKGQPDADQLPPDTNNLKAQISGGQHSHGLIDVGYVLTSTLVSNGATLVKAVTDAISHLETHGHFGPFAVVLPPDFFGLAQQPTHGRPQVTPKDEIVPLLGGGQLLRCSVIPDGQGIVVALGGEPIELVVATDMSLQFLQVTETPNYLFRVYEKLALRIKSTEAVVRLTDKTPTPKPTTPKTR
jgi:uncharacterized linocin/CFP29 family protein